MQWACEVMVLGTRSNVQYSGASEAVVLGTRSNVQYSGRVRRWF